MSFHFNKSFYHVSRYTGVDPCIVDAHDREFEAGQPPTFFLLPHDLPFQLSPILHPDDRRFWRSDGLARKLEILSDAFDV